MDFLKHTFSKGQKNILLIAVIIFMAVGYFQWRDTFFQTYYPDDTSIQGQLFPNVANTRVEAYKNLFPFSEVKYDRIILRIGSLSSEYDDSNRAYKGNNIINRKNLDEQFKKWLIKAFDEDEARKIADHLEVYYRGEKIKEISY